MIKFTVRKNDTSSCSDPPSASAMVELIKQRSHRYVQIMIPFTITFLYEMVFFLLFSFFFYFATDEHTSGTHFECSIYVLLSSS